MKDQLTRGTMFSHCFGESLNQAATQIQLILPCGNRHAHSECLCRISNVLNFQRISSVRVLMCLLCRHLKG